MPEFVTASTKSSRGEPSRPADSLQDFYDDLSKRHLLAASRGERFNAAEAYRLGKPLQKLWQLTETSASEFADEVARFFVLPRMGLADLMAATPRTEKFSARFLRESSIFPCSGEGGQVQLVVADPTDTAAVRATELVLGARLEIVVASFEDLATVLAARLDHAVGPDSRSSASLAKAEDDVESLRDLASGAPVVRALNDLFERAVELRATDIHIEPFESRLVVRMRVDGLLRAVPTPAGALPQALISRVKILSGLNIAERRLPQDGVARQQVSGVDLDIRVATIPTQHGESAVLRLLAKNRGLLEISKLGMESADEAKIKRLLALPHG
ncbi:MAG TPA: ATPase, T2SS/T4P/T4SS family, partial [Bryobacteraceae bacterium]